MRRAFAGGSLAYRLRAGRGRRGNPFALRSTDRSRRTIGAMKAEGTRTCLVCGTQFPVVNEFCPVCMLRGALSKQVAQSLSEGGRAESTTACPSQRFEHYELATGEDGKPVELAQVSQFLTENEIA